jgi:hypothetical protein
MKLTAGLFAEIISSLTSDVMVGRAFEKRLAPRAGLRMQLAIVAVKEGVRDPPISVWVRDISRKGIGLVCTQMLPVGSHFIAQFPQANAELLSVTFRVVQCRSLAKGLFQIGAVSSEAAPTPCDTFRLKH